MKAMSLRMSMQTLSPCLTPRLCSPPAMRATRSVTSSCVRRRSPDTMPRKCKPLSGFNATCTPLPSAGIRKARRALLDIGTDSFELIGAAEQFLLLDGFGEQCRTGIDRELVQHALGGTDRIGPLVRNLARHRQRHSPRIVANLR